MANWINAETGALLNAKLAVWCLSRGWHVRLVGGEGPIRPVIVPGLVYVSKDGDESMFESTVVGGRTHWNGWHRHTAPDGTVTRTLVEA